VVVPLSTGVAYVFNPLMVPICSALPPLAPAYQSMVKPEAAVADRLTLAGPQLAAPLTVAGGAGAGFTCTVTAVLGVEVFPPLVTET